MKRLYLEQKHNPRCIDPKDLANKHIWVVCRVVGSTEPRVHDVLDRQQVQGYCGNETWQVEIK